jgi:exoribonuclease-2
VLLRFDDPSAATLLAKARRSRPRSIRRFLWDVSRDDEFGFAGLAREYFGHAPQPVEAAATLFALHAAPMYFYKRGKGRYRRAPADALTAALASVERKKREAEQTQGGSRSCAAFRLPEALAAKLADAARIGPTRTRRMEGAGGGVRRAEDNPIALLARAARFLHRTNSTSIASCRRVPARHGIPAWGALAPLPDLPLSRVAAFSIDDTTTTEIDDAFSVRELANGHYEVGIHIARAALGIARGTPLDAVARRAAVDRLHAGPQDHDAAGRSDRRVHVAGGERSSRAVALRGDRRRRNRAQAVDARELRARRGELRLPDSTTRSQRLAGGERSAVERGAARVWRMAQRQSELRGKAEISRLDYNFYVDWEAAADGRVRIVPRLRGSPLDRLVSELMIFVNSSWGKVARRREGRGSIACRATAR